MFNSHYTNPAVQIKLTEFSFMPVFYLIFPFFYNDRLSYVGSTCSIMHLFKSALILYRNTYYREIHKTVQSL